MNPDHAKGMSNTYNAPRYNPYARDPIPPMPEINEDQIFDNRARGLTGSSLDSLLRSSFTDGVNEGRRDVEALDRERYPKIYDEGWEQGDIAGYGRGIHEQRQNANDVGASLQLQIGRQIDGLKILHHHSRSSGNKEGLGAVIGELEQIHSLLEGGLGNVSAG